MFHPRISDLPMSNRAWLDYMLAYRDITSSRYALMIQVNCIESTKSSSDSDLAGINRIRYPISLMLAHLVTNILSNTLSQIRYLDKCKLIIV